MTILFQHRILQLQRMFNEDVDFFGRLALFGGLTPSVIAENVLGWVDGILINGDLAPVVVIGPNHMLDRTVDAAMPNMPRRVCRMRSLRDHDSLAAAIHSHEDHTSAKIVVIPNLYDFIENRTTDGVRQTARELRTFAVKHNVFVVAGYPLSDLAQMALKHDPDALMDVTNSGYWLGCSTLSNEADIAMAATIRGDMNKNFVEIVVGKHRDGEPLPVSQRRVLLKRDR